MSTKPTVHAEWDTNNTNVSATTAGHKSDGWANNEIPTAAEFNHWMKQVGDWTKWILESQLNDGTANYTLAANTNAADLTGAGNLTNIHTVYVTPSLDYSINGIVGGVDKQEIRLVNVSGTYPFYLEHEATGATAANRMRFPTSLTYYSPGIRVPPYASVRLRYRSADSRWYMVDAEGAMYYQSFMLHGSLAELYSGGTTTITSVGLVLLQDTNAIHFPVVLPTGSIIDQIVTWVRKTSTGSNTITTTLYSQAMTAVTNSSLGSGSNNSNNPGYVGIPITGPLEAYVSLVETSSPKAYEIEVVQSTSATSDTVIAVEVRAYVTF